MRPPYFPISIEQLLGDVSFCDIEHGELTIGSARVIVRQVPHVGATNGYRVEWGGASVAYVSDHQEPKDRPCHVDGAVLELCEGVDLLIHDAQYTPDEFAARTDWGHCTVRYAVEVAAQAGARQLALFHHDPAHADGDVDELSAQARQWGDELAVPRVFPAFEGLHLRLG
jgi:ribonuclease BN (tRNA processing enzyme)